MAEIVVSFLLKQLNFLLQEENRLLGGLGNNATHVKDELQQMKAFLRAADEIEDGNPQLKNWVKTVREIGYDTEEVLEMYMLQISHPYYDSNGCNPYVKRVYASLKNMTMRHRIASKFKNIRVRLENISMNEQRFKNMYAFMNEGSRTTTYGTRGDALLLEKAEVVGIDEPKEQLLEWLMQGDDGLKVISVVGMGGLGKTTLVKKIYDDASVKVSFDCHVWVTVSENFKLENLLRNMINHFGNDFKLQPRQNLEAMTGDEMKECVFKFLKDKTYVIVLDDVWKLEAWESIRYVFPRRSCRGRIIITTRLYNIGNAACSDTNGNLYQLKPLSDDKAKTLFHRKAFPRNQCPPPYLNDISKKLLRRCEGLPLAIVVIGGLLATKNDELEAWEMFERTIGIELQEENLQVMNKLLSLSYFDLPYYLKACFLYLSIFPKDELLSKWKVIRLWIAENFVEDKDGKTLEEVAETYLNELLNRSLIQVADTYEDGRPRKFRIHDILREYIISKSREQNLLVVANREERKCHDKIRRMVIQTRFNITKESYRVKYLRSLFWFEFANSKELIIQKVLDRCTLLKVLDLRGAPIDNIPNEIFKLYCLKYLSLRGTNIRFIPRSIGNLRNLETLDLKESKVTKFPVEILKLHKLRHLLVYSYNTTNLSSFHFVTQSLKAPYNIGSHLTSLQKLCCIDADEVNGIQIVREIGRLTQLRRLCITRLRRGDGMNLCSSLEKLTNLRTLCIDSIEEDEVLDLDHSLSSSLLPLLRKVVLHGYLEKFPQWVCSLYGLTELQMSWSKLREDPLQHLGALPNLVCLDLGKFSYEGEELIFRGKKFLKLKKFFLWKLRGLRRVRVEKGSMPQLEQLTFSDCELMEELPEGVEHLSNLQLVNFLNMSEAFTGRIAEQKCKGRHEWKLAHVSKVEVWNQINTEWKLQQL